VSFAWPMTIALFALGPARWVLYSTTMLAGVGLGLLGVWWETALAQRIPPQLLSRVSAWDWMGSLALLPLVYVGMNVVYASVAAPAGILSDKIGRENVLLGGLAALTSADLFLAFVPGLGGTMVGVGLWGLYLGLSQGLLSALVADTAPEDLRGTAFGLFNLVTGMALLAASTLAGWLWYAFGPTATFATGAVFSGLTILIMAFGPARK